MNEPVQPEPVTETPAPDAPVDLSLADHEAQFHNAAEPVETPAQVEARERDEQGRFSRPRQRAKSQQAGPDDVPRINELTKRLREVEAERDALKAPQSAAPKPPEAPAQSAQPQPPPQPRQQPQAPQQQFPAFDQWLVVEANKDKSYEDYTDARADWRWAVNHATVQQREHAERAQRYESERMTAYQGQIATAKTKYADFETVVGNPQVVVSNVTRAAILASENGAEIAYALGKNPQLAAELYQDSATHDLSTVGVMKRFLESLLVAPSQRLDPSRAAAAPTGSALALVPPPAPRPPNPVRTSAMKTGDEPPGDKASLEDHEKYYGSPSRRSRQG